MLIPASHALAVSLGGIVGGFPFLLFQALSHFGTWRIQKAFAVSTPLAALLRERFFLLEDTLLSDGENRAMWGGPTLPHWQLWLFPALVALACIVCLIRFRDEDRGRRSFAQFVSLTLLFATASMFFSRLQVAEHHLLMVLPFAVVVVVLACSLLQERFSWARTLSAGLLLIYVCSAFYWQIAAVRGLRNSGGEGVWSDAGLQLARYLDQKLRGREINFVDWGLQFNTYVLTDGRMISREIYSPLSQETSADGKPWIDEIRRGGVFVIGGPENRQFPLPSAGFLRALAASRPEMTTYSVEQRNGDTYAQVIEIAPGSIRGHSPVSQQSASRILMGDPRSDSELNGFYPPDEGRFRWTKREFSANLRLPELAATGALLTVRLYIPENSIRKLGPITLSARCAGHPLQPQTWRQPGQHIYSRELDADWLAPGPVQIDFTLDKSMPPTPLDDRELGIVVSEISIEQ